MAYPHGGEGGVAPTHRPTNAEKKFNHHSIAKGKKKLALSAPGPKTQPPNNGLPPRGGGGSWGTLKWPRTPPPL